MANIRRATGADIEALLPMVRDFHAHEEVGQTDVGRLRALRMVVADPALGSILVADGSLGLQGYCAVLFGTSIEFGGRYGFVDELWVEPPLRGQGIGTRLLARAHEVAVAGGAVVAFLEVSETNAKAQALYARLGYRLHQRRLMSRLLAPPA